MVEQLVFHVNPDGETTPGAPQRQPPPPADSDGFELGVLVGLPMARGPMGRQAVRPAHHDGRSYYQMDGARHYLRETLIPLLDRTLSPELDAPSYQRYQAMKERYGL